MLYIKLYSDYIYVMLFVLLAFACVKYWLRRMPSFSVVLVLEFVLVMVAVLVAALGISSRPGDIEGDTAVYLEFFKLIKAGGENPFGTFEPGFVGLTQLVSALDLDPRIIFFMVPLLLGLGYHSLSRKVFGGHSTMTVIAFVGILIYPFFFSLTANVIRQGLAMALVFYTLGQLLQAHPWRARAGAFSSLFFHRSSVIMLPLVFFRKWCEAIPIWMVTLIWLLVSAASYSGALKALAMSLFEQLAMFGLSVNYGDADAIDYIVGFRWDFWLFSSFSIVFLYALNILGFYKDRVAIIFKVSCYFGIVHIVMFDAAYNDRFGLYAWMLYPIQLLYLWRCLLIRVSQNLVAVEHSAQ